MRELDSYDWRSADAREAYQEIRDLLGREMLDQRFAGMKQAMQNVTPGRRRADPGDARRPELAAREPRAGAGHRSSSSPSSWRKHGEFFPENPQNTDELVDLLAQRAAAAQRMLNSMSAEQRAELAELSQQAFGDPRLAQALAQLDAQLQGLRPGEDWTSPGRFRGDNPLGMGEATRAMEELGRLDALAEQLSQCYPGARLEDIDLDALEAQLGEQARVDARALAELERELRRQGLFERMPDGSLRLSPEGAAAAGGVGAARRRRPARQPPGRAGDPPLRGRGRTDRRDPAVGVRRHRGLARARAR